MRTTPKPLLEELVHTWRLPLFAIALARVSEVEDAEDIVQTVLLRVARRSSIADVRDPGAYLRTAVLNQCRNMLARRRPLHALPEEEPADAATATPSSDAGAVRGLLRDAIRTMRKTYRVAMWLVYVEGVAPGEAAQLLGQSLNTTKSTLARGRRILRERLGPVLRKAGYLEL